MKTTYVTILPHLQREKEEENSLTTLRADSGCYPRNKHFIEIKQQISLYTYNVKRDFYELFHSTFSIVWTLESVILAIELCLFTRTLYTLTLRKRI